MLMPENWKKNMRTSERTNGFRTDWAIKSRKVTCREMTITHRALLWCTIVCKCRLTESEYPPILDSHFVVALDAL